MTEHVKTRRYLRSIPSKSEFERVLKDVKISDDDIKIMRMFYIEDKPFDFIADTVGISVNTVYKRHEKILQLISMYRNGTK